MILPDSTIHLAVRQLQGEKSLKIHPSPMGRGKVEEGPWFVPIEAAGL
jgi:hypothetical protein